MSFYRLTGSENTVAVRALRDKLKQANIAVELRTISELWIEGGDGTDSFERATQIIESNKPRRPRADRRRSA